MPAAELRPLAFGDLQYWDDDDHAAAFAAFRRGADVIAEHPPKSRALGVDALALTGILARAAELSVLSATDAKAFFEAEFQPFEVASKAAPANGAFFTGYYEPEVMGSLQPTGEYTVPLYRTPPDLVEVAPGEAPQLDPSLRFARQTAAGLAEHPDRKAIMAGALGGRDLELLYVADPVDAFFIHVQGAARIKLADGRTMRITYDAKSGHPYTPIGRVVIEMGVVARDNVTMQTIRAWLAAHPGEADAVMAANRSYIFFREAPVTDAALGPVAAAKMPLTAGRSLAVDRLLHTFHSPVWAETSLPGGSAFRRLMMAQDTGSAIIGPARGDIFFGSGAEAGEIAGAMRASGRFVLLMPRGAGR